MACLTDSLPNRSRTSRPPKNFKSKSTSSHTSKSFVPMGRGSTYFAVLVLFSACFSHIGVTNAAILGMTRREAPNARNVVFYNQSGRRVDILWINRSTNPVSFVSNSDNGEGYPYGASQGINSYIGHEFEIREMPSKKTGDCITPGKCQKAYFQVNDQEGQKITIDKHFTVKHEDDRTKARDEADLLLSQCRQELEQKSLDSLQLIDKLTECMELKVNQTLKEREGERSFQSHLRNKMAEELVPYACGDPNFETSVEFVNRSFHFEDVPGNGRRKFQLQVFHERPTSSIFQIQNFTRPEECDALKFFIEGGNHVPVDAVNDMTKQGKLVNTLATKFYELAAIALGWEGLDLQTQNKNFAVSLLDVHKDNQGVSVMPVCSNEELDALKTDGSEAAPVSCRLPGATPEKVPTKIFELAGPGHVATIFLFCGQGKQQLGGLHFPDAAVHIQQQPNLLVMAIHKTLESPASDGFTDKYHFCPNYDILTHTFLYGGKVSDPKATTGRTISTTSSDEL